MQQAVLKLTSGETIIADIVSKDTNNVEVSNPMLVRNGIDEHSRLVVTLIKWIETQQPTIKIGDQHVITTAQPSQFLVEYYNETVAAEMEAESEELDQTHGYELRLNSTDNTTIH